ncbi:STAS/SEC14 domain-containing protein [candidate division WOR-3 bacterium]|nr:STAS/SEC14 domain-containing protein [candidate division WOR-3 bacterium]
MKSYNLTYDDKSEILSLKVLRPLDREGLIDLELGIQKLLKGKPLRNVLVDMTESVQFSTDFMNKEVRNSYKVLMEQMNVEKSAIVGASPVIRMIAKIAISVSGKSDVNKFFETREEAMAWLKGDK